MAFGQRFMLDLPFEDEAKIFSPKNLQKIELANKMEDKIDHFPEYSTSFVASSVFVAWMSATIYVSAHIAASNWRGTDVLILRHYFY